ncbi:hypothetical protein FVB9532_03908 [Mesonia oceanica]|uniref:Uncharacterized protein n=1 Tax=Mesonia oceanica TaxID=2687242 RepID=A0AC61YDN6_9FLAO|nr:hypothetical protein FVB9532_03908 [Mesonia oceanica]
MGVHLRLNELHIKLLDIRVRLVLFMLQLKLVFVGHKGHKYNNKQYQNYKPGFFINNILNMQVIGECIGFYSIIIFSKDFKRMGSGR